MPNKTPLKQNLEKQLAIFLLNELENLRLSPEQIKIIANFFLNLIPTKYTDEELQKKLSKLDPNFFKAMKQGDFKKALQMTNTKEL
jgi:hypothetical protein